MHECPDCGMACDCDCEDLEQDAPDDCSCDHEGSRLDEFGEPINYDNDYD